jgi:hypothetical protein
VAAVAAGAAASFAAWLSAAALTSRRASAYAASNGTTAAAARSHCVSNCGVGHGSVGPPWMPLKPGAYAPGSSLLLKNAPSE